MIGWMNFVSSMDKAEVEKIKEVATQIRAEYDAVVVVGIGGSYIGARSLIEAINGVYSKDKIEVFYLGNTLSARYTQQVLNYLENKKFAILVISKSGKTLETTIAFRLLKQLLKKQNGENFVNSVYVVTDKTSGNLRAEADIYGYKTFDIPSNIGGRYSVITPVGLLPMAVAGVDIEKFLLGCSEAEKDLATNRLADNPCYQYAIIRNVLQERGKSIELFVTYEPQLKSFSEWLKQLFGESEGKDKKGIFPASAAFSTDLHSLGQFIQDGTQCLFETVLNFEDNETNLNIPDAKADYECLNAMAGTQVSKVNNIIFQSVLMAHTTQGGVPNIVFNVDKLDEYNMGYLVYFFMKACAFSSFIQGVYPFDQPGVEIYKENAHALLNDKK